MSADRDLSRCSLNTASIKRATLPEAVDAAARAGYGAIGLWRDRVQETGAEKAAKLVADAGLRVSSLCRGGFLTASDEAGIAAALDDNRAAIVEAATVGTSELVFVVGGLPGSAPETAPAPGTDRDVVAARARVADRIADLAPFAAEHGVRIVLEPLHPMFAADRAVISTLGQALDLAAPHPADVVGVVVDTYHVWWDPALEASIARAGAEQRIASYQVCDWALPFAPLALNSRGHVGDGYVDFPTISRWVAAAGYRGDVETELFNQEIWDAPFDDTVATIADRYLRHVQPYVG
ncbi:sugar phosphate isomerase/epimerase [Sediminihabitans luteus]|uniref:Sugar phosphate isomerase/epimerase n=1 Tax=Sediminihabitans luteus TaxID=1138585 RepID=A0A2M9D080_9CELL|nr:sugar phosphate isomerase/epimerase family protein [Sediminihabitans luteus]PJJ77408.1 sugar phosphate isomerase/epimerase [Sediminihabitans luteus]GII98301.1 3-dehydroshikimate dehydratase [Sediminihabitans luteus]